MIEPKHAGEEDIRRVGVIGCGIMGAGIAELCALAGTHVSVAVRATAAKQRARSRIHASLERAAVKGRVSQAQGADALDRIDFTTELDDLTDCQLVIEAVAEDEPVKAALFRELDSVVADGPALLASTTSSIPIGRLAAATTRPARVLGTHFFNPVPATALVELIGTPDTAPAALRRAERFLVGTLGKEVIRAPDRPCFLVNALLVPFMLAAIRVVESGLASAEEVDRSMVLGCRHPIGPLRLADLVGLDTVAAAAASLHEHSRESLHAPPTMLLALIAEGRLGRKSGAGFFSYDR